MHLLHYPQQNRLLAALAREVQDRLFPQLELVPMPLDFLVHEPLGKLRYAYFPTTCLVSKLSSLESGASAEIGVIGNDGMVSVCLFMGGESMPHETVVKCAGYAYRVKSQVIKEEFNRTTSTQQVFLRYTQALLTQMAQTAVCNRHHMLDQQLCRYLLLNLDRLVSSEFEMTQERIAIMLGVRREGVTEAAKKLQSAGVIHYSRGHIHVVDRKGLEARACECYQVVKTEFDRLLPAY